MNIPNEQTIFLHNLLTNNNSARQVFSIAIINKTVDRFVIEHTNVGNSGLDFWDRNTLHTNIGTYKNDSKDTILFI